MCAHRLQSAGDILHRIDQFNATLHVHLEAWVYNKVDGGT